MPDLVIVGGHQLGHVEVQLLAEVLFLVEGRLQASLQLGTEPVGSRYGNQITIQSFARLKKFMSVVPRVPTSYLPYLYLIR